ncbi:MAG: hypothetical protein HFH80_15400, partial [Lachnospiraceae bacterium]|nr:hypothetical protein [Lachnospiraceae bacterium]
ESSQPEVQDPQEENSAGGGEESSQPEVQDPQEDNPAGEGNESSLSVEGCYDDPDNPVEDQNYNVGEPKYE